MCLQKNEENVIWHLLEQELVKNFILSPKRARFSVRVNISVKDIITFHKKGIWDLNLQFLSKQLVKLVWLSEAYSSQNPYAKFFPLWELSSPFLTFFKEQLFIELVACHIHCFLAPCFWAFIMVGTFLRDFSRFGEAGMKQQSYVQNSRLLSWKYYRKK